MNRIVKFILMGAIVGLLIGVPIGLHYLGYTLSKTYIREILSSDIFMSEAELDRVTQMAFHGAILHFVVMVVLPSLLTGAGFGALAGWLRRGKKSALYK